MTLIYAHDSGSELFAISDVALSKRRLNVDWDSFPSDHQYSLLDTHRISSRYSKSIILSARVLVLWSGIFKIALKVIERVSRLDDKDGEIFLQAAGDIIREYSEGNLSFIVLFCDGVMCGRTSVNVDALKTGYSTQLFGGSGAKLFKDFVNGDFVASESDPELMLSSVVKLLHYDVRYADFRSSLFGGWFEIALYFPDFGWRKIGMSNLDCFCEGDEFLTYGGPRFSIYHESNMILVDCVSMDKPPNIWCLPQSVRPVQEFRLPVGPVFPDVNSISLNNYRGNEEGVYHNLYTGLRMGGKESKMLGVEFIDSSQIRLIITNEYADFMEEARKEFLRGQAGGRSSRKE